MAKSGNEKKEKSGTAGPSPKKKTSASTMTRMQKFRIISGAFLLLFSILLLLAFLSHLLHWRADGSFGWSDLFSTGEKPAENAVSKLGAVLANSFMGGWFGIPSLALPFLLFLTGLYLLTRKGDFLKRILIHVLFWTLWSASLLGILFFNSDFLGFGPGGEIGQSVAAWFKGFSGYVGAFLIICFAGFLFLAVAVEGSLGFFAALARGLFSRSAPAAKNQIPPEKVLEELPVPAPVETDSEDSTPFSIEITDEEPEKILPEKPRGKSMDEPIVRDDFEDEEIGFREEPGPSPDDLGDEGFEVAQPNREESVQETPSRVSRGEIDAELLDSSDDEASPDEEMPQGDYDPTADLSAYKFPPLSLLVNHKLEDSEVSKEELVANKNKIVETLRNYKIEIDKIKATIGPTITLYEIVPAPGIRISKIKNLEDDIALSLSALGIRIIAPIPGKGTIGIEVPNLKPEIVSMRSILASQKFQESRFELPVALGKTISNETYTFDLAKMPHLLVAGATGQGKSVGLNAIITSLLYKKHPAELKFVLVDPKKVELTLYSRLEKHFLAMLPDTEEPIITDNDKVVATLYSLTVEMDRRYELLKKAQVRNLKEYNAKFISRRLNPHKGHRFLPYIVVVIDEFADLIMTAGKEVEAPIARIAQLARAIGIHLIIATQRPSTNVITGLIKANFPARLAFRTASMIDSRTILDHPGANQLIGRGDMLISQGSEMVRLQCAFIDTPEIEELVEFIGNQAGYSTAFLLPEVQTEGGEDGKNVDLGQRDDLFEEAAHLLVIHQQGSTSLIQRKFSIGYNRAGRIMDQLEAAGIVGPNEGSKARQVNFMDEFSLEQYLKTLP